MQNSKVPSFIAFPMHNPPKFRGRHTINCRIYKMWNCGIEKKKQNTYDRTVIRHSAKQRGGQARPLWWILFLLLFFLCPPQAANIFL